MHPPAIAPARRRALIIGVQALYRAVSASTDYGDKRRYGISVMDPGAVPGASTNQRLKAVLGGEIGSTCVVKTRPSLGMVPPLSGQTHSCQRQLCGGTPRRVMRLVVSL